MLIIVYSWPINAYVYAGENEGGTIASYTCLGRKSVEKFKKH